MKLLRNYIIVLAVIAVVAVTLAVLSVTGYLTRGSEVVVSPGDPWTVQGEEEGNTDLGALFHRVLNRAEAVTYTPILPQKKTTVTLQTRTGGGKFAGAYSLHVISMIDRSAYVQDLQTNRWYRLSVRDFELLLSHNLLEQMILDRYQPPVVTMKGADWSKSPLLATEERILVYTAQGTFRKITRKTEDILQKLIITEEQGSKGISVTGNFLPDAWSVTVVKDGEPFLTQQNVTTSEIFFPSQEGNYRYILTAHWELSAQRDWYGEVDYVLSIHMEKPQPPQDLPQDSEGEFPNP